MLIAKSLVDVRIHIDSYLLRFLNDEIHAGIMCVRWLSLSAQTVLGAYIAWAMLEPACLIVYLKM